MSVNPDVERYSWAGRWDPGYARQHQAGKGGALSG